MGKGPAEWSQSIPNKKVNDASISTTFKLILNWYGPITTSSSIIPTVCLYLIGRNFRMPYGDWPSSSFYSYPYAPQGLYTAQRANIQTTPIINQHCRYYLGPTRHQNRKRVRVGCPIGGDLFQLFRHILLWLLESLSQGLCCWVFLYCFLLSLVLPWFSNGQV